MDDLNLIPQEMKAAAEFKIKKIKAVLILTIAVLLIAALSCIPLYLTYGVNSQNKLLEDGISKLSSVNSEINNLNIQKNAIQDRMKILDTLSKQEQKWTGVISYISSITPEEISFNVLNAGTDTISMQGSATGIQPIAVFVANIENGGRFSDIRLNDVSPNDKNTSLTFNISFKLINIEGKVK